ncbi:MAG: translation initiation factor IF-2 N-terminal domain-containing protein, partial [Bacillota bacterium]|nr:translation initiation factor IF-2 N-terminal domain-containing protein [Bacillota bacterium]
MAKLKVHELAKELNKQSKEIIAFLQDKGIEVKAAQSALEDEAVSLVRKAFGQGKTKTEEKEVVEENTPKADTAVKNTESAVKSEASQSEAVKN